MAKTATPSAKNMLLGAGKVFFDRWDNDGNPTGIRHLGNVPTFELNEEVTKITKKQSMYAAKTTYLEVVSEIKSTANITLEEFTPENLAMAFLGEEGVLLQTDESVSDEAYIASPGRIIQLKDAYNVSKVSIKPASTQVASISPAEAYGTTNTSNGTVTSSGTYSGTEDANYYIRITAAPTVAGTIAGCTFQWKKELAGAYSIDVTAGATAATLELGVKVLLAVTGSQTFVVGDMYKIVAMAPMTEYVEGKDFKTEASMLRAGLITIPATSSITEGQAVKVSYDRPAGAYPKIAMATVGSVEGYLLFAGDPTKGPAYNADMWHVNITPNGALGFIGDDTGSFQVTVSVLDDRENHPDEPLYRLIKLN
ncbi:hypothetical protein [Pelosinus fermentans]|uniref:Uncharacterized protein n=1 Tax=Pelosinus fermentans JBW45 TaxID=1192197 RepID=I8TQM5_9FIRM|nr:hypothetical protein [Pelosinus fermentans]AJQ26917.1 hypothetical protein JBW_01567 [Pelosinus fermentans JBW45]